MIQFPETAAAEWQIVADAANAKTTMRRRLELDSLVERAVEKLRINHEAKEIFQQEIDAENTPPLEMVTLASYTPAAAPVDMIEGVMKEDGLCVVLGPSGSGKSTVALQMLHSLMSGNDWLGQPVKPIMGSVGVLSYDMEAGMIMDWMSGFPNIDPHRVSVVNAHKRGNPVGVPAMRRQIASTWRAMNVEAVVLDSFSASFFGHDENDAAATMAHYRDMKMFALTEVGAKALIVIVHSTEKSPLKARGSTVHKDTSDTMVAVVSDLDTGKRTVSVEKYRAARGQQMMSPVIVGAPDDVTHLVDLDTGAMALAGLPIPPGYSAQLFTPEPYETPETESDTESEDNL